MTRSRDNNDNVQLNIDSDGDIHGVNHVSQRSLLSQDTDTNRGYDHDTIRFEFVAINGDSRICQSDIPSNAEKTKENKTSVFYTSRVIEKLSSDIINHDWRNQPFPISNITGDVHVICDFFTMLRIQQQETRESIQTILDISKQDWDTKHIAFYLNERKSTKLSVYNAIHLFCLCLHFVLPIVSFNSFFHSDIDICTSLL